MNTTTVGETLDAKELLILSQFRKNARENLTTAAKRIRMPISTIYEKLKRYEKTIIQKYTSLLNFSQMGYAIKLHLVIRVELKDKLKLRQFLTNNSRVNSLFAISNGYDFMAEVILKDFNEVEDFIQALSQFAISDMHEFYVTSDLKREEFLSDIEVTMFPQ
jgi:DNA-binding Lrp family transcriptional regulator